MRYAWDQFDAYFGPQRLGRPASWVMRMVMNRLARWDRETADRRATGMSRTLSMLRAGSADTIIARRLWCIRRSTPISSVPTRPLPSAYALVVSALVPYKRLDVAIDACRLAACRSQIVGTGPERAAARAAAGASDVRVPRPADRRGGARRCIDGAAVVMLPGEEDFGIVPARSAGVRPAGGGLRARRRARNRGAGRNRRPGERGDPRSVRGRHPTRGRSALRFGRHPAPRRAVRPRAVRRRDGRTRSTGTRLRDTRW